ncbi:MAG: hypothetical protein KatS3mg087_1748 [Patescibacteria group bacterium]|nr:MAG: hypothetical protein KatS3mg087_1748 [Patescibacteria group bacterium]
MKRNESDLMASFLEKQDTIIGMLQMVVRAVYDAQQRSDGGATSVIASGGNTISNGGTEIPIPLPSFISNTPLDVNVQNTPLGVNVQNTPLNVNVQNASLPVSQSGSWNVQISGQPISVSITSNLVRKFASINTNSLGDTTIVSAVSGKRIRVVALAVVAGNDVSVRFKSGSSWITGILVFGPSGGIAHTFDGGLFQTNINESLIINLSAAVQVGGYLVYEEI